ncbi:MAG: hypothetical protein H5U03_02385 [Clostridia bacterium]|nr:hypothetical protein [Clostridia bacterium]
MEYETQYSPAPPRDIPEDEIDLRDIILVLWRHRWFIIGVFLVSVLAASIISFAMAPVYRVHTVIALGQYPSSIYTNPAAVREMLLSDDFLWQVVGEVQPNISEKDFQRFKDSIKVEQVKEPGILNMSIETTNRKDTIKVEKVQEPGMLRISVETTDPKEGKAVLEKMVALFKDQSRSDFEQYRQLLTDQLSSVKARLLEVEKTIRETRQNLAALEAAPGLTRAEKDFRRFQLLEALQGFEDQHLALLDRYLGLEKELNSLEDVKVIQSPREPAYPEKPNRTLNIAVAGVLGLMVGVLGAFVIEFFRRNLPGFRQTG